MPEMTFRHWDQSHLNFSEPSKRFNNGVLGQFFEDIYREIMSAVLWIY